MVMFLLGEYVGSDFPKAYPADVWFFVRAWWRNPDPRTCSGITYLVKTNPHQGEK